MLPKGFKINRSARKTSGKIEEFFPHLSKLPAIKKIFSQKKSREKIFAKTLVRMTSKNCHYMRIVRGKLLINPKHLKNSDKGTIYLDILHELVHVRQWMQGKNLYDERYNYFERPTEIEAYKFCIREAKKIGMKKYEIIHYLEVEWAEREEFERMLRKFRLTN